jgi:c-di-GMP-binding flagellar brake protein YcgR
MSALPSYLQQAWPIERQLERFKLEQPLKLSISGGEIADGKCEDVSIGGMGARVDAPLQLGQEVGLEFQLPTQEKVLNLRGVVRHLEAGRCGFEFLTITPEQLDSILAYGRSLTEKKRPMLRRT